LSELGELAALAHECTRCGLSRQRTHVVFGEGNPQAGLMVVGEGPGRDEDLQGRPFVGRSGQLLERLLREEGGLDRRDVYIANVVKCRPPGNRDPRPDEIAACRPYLDRQVSLIGPAVILTVGNFSTRCLLGTAEGITQLRGRSHPWPQAPSVAVVPTYHPAAALRSGGEVLARMRADIVRARALLDAAGRGPGYGPATGPATGPAPAGPVGSPAPAPSRPRSGRAAPAHLAEVAGRWGPSR
jgi:uracil-DNA glycosylase family 4